MTPTNPCLTCGACCAHFRVSFYWGEADPAQGGTVPLEMTEDLTEFRRCMKGTSQKHPRCAALLGEVGSAVRCTIYEGRPSPCREFGIEWDADHLCYTAEDLERCTRARAEFGLPPLTDLPLHTPSTDDQTPPIIHAA